jgi:hypothetical protein
VTFLPGVGNINEQLGGDLVISHGPAGFIHPFHPWFQLLTEPEITVINLETSHALQIQPVHGLRVGFVRIIPHDDTTVGNLSLEQLSEAI